MGSGGFHEVGLDTLGGVALVGCFAALPFKVIFEPLSGVVGGRSSEVSSKVEIWLWNLKVNNK